MKFFNYILHITFVGVQKTSTKNPYPSTTPLGGRGFSAFLFANVVSCSCMSTSSCNYFYTNF